MNIFAMVIEDVAHGVYKVVTQSANAHYHRTYYL